MAIDMTDQVNAWLEGVSLHMEDPDMCCPDYSCCVPPLQAHLEERELYAQAWAKGDMKTVERLDCWFLGRLIVHHSQRKVQER